jgi:hypothetical protein
VLGAISKSGVIGEILEEAEIVAPTDAIDTIHAFISVGD